MTDGEVNPNASYERNDMQTSWSEPIAAWNAKCDFANQSMSYCALNNKGLQA